MKARTWIVIVAAIALAFLLGTAHIVRQDTALVEAERDAVRQRSKELERQVRERTLLLEKHGEPKYEPQPLLTPTPAVAPQKKTYSAPSLAELATVRPQILNEFLASKQAEVQERYGAFFERWSLSPSQRQQMRDILAGGLESSIDIFSARSGLGLPDDDAAIKTLTSDSERQQAAQLTALLGSGVYQEFQEFQRSTAARGFADRLAARLCESEPLTAGQAERLSRVLAIASLSYRGGQLARGNDIDWTFADLELKTILRPSQYEVWRNSDISTRYGGGSRLRQELERRYAEAIGRKTER